MLTLRDHRSRELFDPWEHLGVKRRRLLELSWAGVLSVTTGKQPLFAAPSTIDSYSIRVNLRSFAVPEPALVARQEPRPPEPLPASGCVPRTSTGDFKLFCSCVRNSYGENSRTEV